MRVAKKSNDDFGEKWGKERERIRTKTRNKEAYRTDIPPRKREKEETERESRNLPWELASSLWQYIWDPKETLAEKSWRYAPKACATAVSFVGDSSSERKKPCVEEGTASNPLPTSLGREKREVGIDVK